MCRQDGFRLGGADNQGDNGAGEVADEGSAFRDWLLLALVKDLGAAGDCGGVVLAQALGHLDIGARVGGRVLDYAVVVDVGHCELSRTRSGSKVDLGCVGGTGNRW